MENLKIEKDQAEKLDKEEKKELPFDPNQNESLIRALHSVSMDKRLKFSNPIRDYCHLLSNRLIHHLIALNSQISKSQTLFNTFKG